MKKPISPARQWWRDYHRLERIARRESAKAFADVMNHGTGVIMHTTGGARHVPYADLFYVTSDTPLRTAVEGWFIDCTEAAAYTTPPDEKKIPKHVQPWPNHAWDSKRYRK